MRLFKVVVTLCLVVFVSIGGLTACGSKSEREKSPVSGSSSGSAVSGEAISENGFSDRTGEKLSDIMQNVDFSRQGASTSWHNMALYYNGNIQADGHFYYITCDNKDDIDDEFLDEEDVIYTVYRDRGEKVGTFTTKGELEACIFYQNNFYFEKISFDQLTLDSTYCFQRLEKDGKSTDLTKFSLNINDMMKETNGHNFIVYEDKVYRGESTDGSDRLVRVKEDGSEETLVKQIIGMRGGRTGGFAYMVVDGKMYYAVPENKKISLYYIDLATGEQVKFYSYEKKRDKGGLFLKLNMDSDYIYCGKDRISIQTGEVKQYPLDDGTSFIPARQYIFYMDKKDRLHRIDKKTDQDKMITTKKISKIHATEEGLFVELYDKKLENKIDEDFDMEERYMWYNYYPANLYYMDFDGKNMEKLPGSD